MVTTPEGDEIKGQWAALFGRAAPLYDTVIPFFARIGARLVDHAGIRPGERVLDVGTGRGAVLLAAAERVGAAGRVVGIDLAPEMVEAAALEVERRGLAQAEVRVMDAENLDLPSEEFDAVLCNCSVQFLPDRARGAREFARVTRTGGRVAISAPAGGGPEWGFQGELVRRYEAMAERPMLPAPPPVDVGGFLIAGGLSDVEVTEVVETFTFPDGETFWRWSWSQAMRRLYEALPQEALDRLGAELVGHVEAMRGPQGAVLHQRAAVAIGHKR